MENKEKVFDIITDVIGAAQDELSTDKLLVEDLYCDSLDIFEIVMSIEKEFNISVADDKYTDLKTVGDLVNLVEGK
jgi:acyl carrier protein